MNFKIGDKASISKTFTEDDVTKFSEISLDKNPIHLDDDFAKKSIFKNRICHGFLSGSLISAVLGTVLPGEGAIYLSQTLIFKKPVYINDTVIAEVEVLTINKEKGIIKMATVCTNHLNEIVITGEAVLKV